MDENEKRPLETESRIRETPEQVNTDFLTEQIKQRPINRKKLMRRTLLTSLMAVLFGTIACVSFLVLEPLINSALYPGKEEPAPITFPEETGTEEISPQQLLAEDREKGSEQEELELRIQRLVTEKSTDAAAYANMHRSLKKIAEEAGKAMVTVTRITQDYNWFNDQFDHTGRTAGVVVAKTDMEYLVLVRDSGLSSAKRLQISFSDGSVAEARIKQYDRISGYGILEMSISALSSEVRKNLQVASLGISSGSDPAGRPVIAIGSPTGEFGSVEIGMITGGNSSIDLTDAVYKRITTDIYTSSEASGVLIDLNGQVIGLTDLRFNDPGSANLLSAIGISEIKGLIELLSNGKQQPYLGIHGVDVTDQARDELHVPKGTYIRYANVDSPAMKAGLQSGDVITSFNGADIGRYRDLITSIRKCTVGETVPVKYMRSLNGIYTEQKTQITLEGATQ